MKTAICLYGLVGSSGGKSDTGMNLNPAMAYNLNKKTLLELNSPDIFIHTWSTELEDELRDLYKPKKMIAEPQVKFEIGCKSKPELNLKNRLRYFLSRAERKKIVEENAIEVSRAKSRWYSTLKSTSLMAEFEREELFEYDAVMLLRFDVAFYSPLSLGTYNLQKIWTSHWNIAPSEKNRFRGDFSNQNMGRGLLDFWFFSNSKNIKNFADLYKNFSRYNSNPHRASFERIKDINLEIGYTKYRWYDHEMVRRREFGSQL